jgi:hypothetical protein
VSAEGVAYGATIDVAAIDSGLVMNQEISRDKVPVLVEMQIPEGAEVWREITLTGRETGRFFWYSNAGKARR